MKRKLLDLLACPIDKHYPLLLYEFEINDDIIINGLLFCSKCNRYYPIIDEIPVMLPDSLRKTEEDLSFLDRWKEKMPNSIVLAGKPYNLS